ncbi:hypothetical protein [Marinitoga sp. 38H-ov]|uniref:hypothetical protein n=1 Tax=Marinitoga sp. 38H-ov TaxID=1755814 RepID=UPI0013EBBE23|nr:hypothetical protein [Marinitoga sp. 38H-ov]KAF2955629.1 hypothetical protein AS160_00505 [Marinitoga sp. 38H-ov]
MKKVLALVMALALMVSAFAATEVPATLSVTNPVFEGSVSFEIGFDENGLDLKFDNSLKVTTAFYQGYSATFGGGNSGMLTVVLSGDLVGVAKDTIPAFSLSSITYEDDMLKAVFNNSGILDYSKYIVYNTYDDDGNAQLPKVGDRHALVTLKDLGLDFLYVDLTSDYDVTAHATGDTLFLNGDLLAGKKDLTVSMFDVNMTAAAWSADSTRLAVTGPATKTGFAVAFETTGKDAVEGLTADLVVASHAGSLAYMLDAGYKKDYEAGMFTVTPHMTFDYAKSAMLPEFVKPISDATKVTFGADLSADFGVAGNVKLTDTITLPLPGDISYTYAVTYANKVHDLFNLEYLTVTKTDGTELATPFTLKAKVSGSTTMDAISAGYDVTLLSVALDKVADEYVVNAHANAGYEADMVSVMFDAWYILDAETTMDATDLGYKATVELKPMDKVTATFVVRNFSGKDSDSDGSYFDEEFMKPGELVYTADLTYAYTDNVTAGFHFGTEDNYGMTSAIHWYGYVKGSVSF